MKRFREHARDMSVTLHRAFDMCRDPFAALEEAISLDIQTILTSGQAPDCLHGVDLLNKLHQAADGRIHLLAGAGVSAKTVPALLEKTSLTPIPYVRQDQLKTVRWSTATRRFLWEFPV